MNTNLLASYLKRQNMTLDTLLTDIKWDKSILNDDNQDRHITLLHIKQIKRLLNLTHNEVLMLFEINTCINAPMLHLSHNKGVTPYD